MSPSSAMLAAIDTKVSSTCKCYLLTTPYHQKTGIGPPFTEGLRGGRIRTNLGHETWPSCIPIFPPVGDLPFKWEVLCLNSVATGTTGQKRPPVMPLH